jgi:hypothetical protein
MSVRNVFDDKNEGGQVNANLEQSYVQNTFVPDFIFLCDLDVNLLQIKQNNINLPTSVTYNISTSCLKRYFSGFCSC